jgi:hypothetical protein
MRQSTVVHAALAVSPRPFAGNDGGKTKVPDPLCQGTLKMD